LLLDPAHALDHAGAVAVRGVDHDGVDAGLHQGFDALLGAVAHADRGAYAQAPARVACGVGEAGLLGDVLDGDEALELPVAVDDQEALELVLVEQRLGIGERRAVGHGDELVALRHDFADGHVVAGFKAQVAPRHDADDLAAVDDREAGDAQLVGQRHHLAHRVRRRDHHRVAQDARFIALHAGHFGGLLLRGEVLVHDPHAALLRDGDREAGFCHGVHGRRDERQVQRDVAGEFGGEGGVLGQDLGERWHQQHVVEGERFAEKAHG
jgi:hypothetical protein